MTRGLSLGCLVGADGIVRTIEYLETELLNISLGYNVIGDRFVVRVFIFELFITACVRCGWTAVGVSDQRTCSSLSINLVVNCIASSSELWSPFVMTWLTAQ